MIPLLSVLLALTADRLERVRRTFVVGDLVHDLMARGLPLDVADLVGWLAELDRLPFTLDLSPGLVDDPETGGHRWVTRAPNRAEIMHEAAEHGFRVAYENGISVLFDRTLRYAIRFEPWCMRCVDDGHLERRRLLTRQDQRLLDGRVKDDGSKRLQLYQREGVYRREILPEGHPDGAPDGYPVYVGSVWKTAIDVENEYDFVELQIWRASDTTSVESPSSGPTGRMKDVVREMFLDAPMGTRSLSLGTVYVEGADGSDPWRVWRWSKTRDPFADEGARIYVSVSDSRFENEIWRAKDSGKASRMTYAAPDARVLWINLLEVSPTGEGVGGLVLREIIRWAERRGYDLVMGVASPPEEENEHLYPDVERFYRTNGFDVLVSGQAWGLVARLLKEPR